MNSHLSEQMRQDAETGLITPLSDDHRAIVDRLTDMIVMAFYQDRSLEPAEPESARMLASIRAIWLGAWGAPEGR